MNLFNRKKVREMEKELLSKKYVAVTEVNNRQDLAEGIYEKIKYAFERGIITKAEFRQYLKEVTGIKITPEIPLGFTNEDTDRRGKAMPNFKNPLQTYEKVVNSDGLLSPQRPQKPQRGSEAQ